MKSFDNYNPSCIVLFLFYPHMFTLRILIIKYTEKFKQSNHVIIKTTRIIHKQSFLYPQSCS